MAFVLVGKHSNNSIPDWSACLDPIHIVDICDMSCKIKVTKGAKKNPSLLFLLFLTFCFCFFFSLFFFTLSLIVDNGYRKMMTISCSTSLEEGMIILI